MVLNAAAAATSVAPESLKRLADELVKREYFLEACDLYRECSSPEMFVISPALMLSNRF